jgi:hypothetical protein
VIGAVLADCDAARLPLRIVGLLEGWERTDPAVIRAMVERVAALRAEGADLIED